MINVCVVGYGSIGPIHANALTNTEGVVLYGVCDPDVDRRKKCVNEFGSSNMVIHEYEDYDEMLKDDNIHSVHICTPHYLHYEMIQKALKANKLVVTEKPVTRTKDEFTKLLSADGIENVCVTFQNRLNPCIIKFKEIIEKKELGDIKAVRAVLTWNRGRSYYESADWRGKWDTEGGGLLINQAIHTLDYFSYLIGNVVSVNANMFNYSLKDVIEVEDSLVAVLRMDNGVQGMFFATNAYGTDSAPLFEVTFERGSVRYIDNKLWMGEKIIECDIAPKKGKSYWGSAHEDLIKRFYENGQCFSVYDVKNTMETTFAIYESSGSNGNTVLV